MPHAIFILFINKAYWSGFSNRGSNIVELVSIIFIKPWIPVFPI